MRAFAFHVFIGLGATVLAATACSNNNNNSGDAAVDSSIDSGVDAGDATAEADAAGGDAGDAANDVSADALDAADAATDAASLTDQQIVGVVQAANAGEIEEALLATGLPDGGLAAAVDGGLDASVAADIEAGFDAGTGRSSNASVLAFAKMMISDHLRSDATIASFGITPATSNVQTSVTNTTEGTLALLSPLNDGAFDVAYLRAQVTSHTAMRDLITAQLVPSATDPTLKSYLNATLLPTIEMHLTQATTLLSQLTDGGALVDGAAEATAP